jgi:LPXTG-motif cell wall-anchored protein
VRAYKGTGESASSNTVNAVSLDNLAPTAPSNFVFIKQAYDYTFTWDKNSETDLAGYLLEISDLSGKLLKTIEIAKDVDIYELIVGDIQELQAGTEYEFALIAKDSNNNLSEKAIASEKNDNLAASAFDTKKSNSIWYILGGVLVLLLAGGGVYWFKFRKKKHGLSV